MGAVIEFLESVTGRTIRVLLGILLLALGFFVMHGGLLGTIVAIIGLIVLATGVFGILLLAPIFGYTMTGHKRMEHVGS